MNVYNVIALFSYTAPKYYSCMKRFFSLLFSLVILLHLCYAVSMETSVNKVMNEDSVSRDIRYLLKGFNEPSSALDSLRYIVDQEKESPYYLVRKAMLGSVMMRLINNANVERIQQLFDEYTPYLKQLDEQYYFYEDWYYLVECYLFSGHVIVAADEARQVYVQAVNEGDKLGLALSTYVLGMFYQMQNLNLYAYKYYSQALPIFKEAKNWDFYDVAGINTIEVMKNENISDGIEDIFITLDSLADETIKQKMQAPLNIYNVLITKGICSTYIYGHDQKKLKYYRDQTRNLFQEYSGYVVDSIALQTIERAYARLTGDVKSELKYTLAIYRNMNLRKELANLGTETKALADCYEKLGDRANAFYYLKRYIDLNDSLNLVIKQSSIDNVAAEYNVDRLTERNSQLAEEVVQSKKVVMWLLFGLMVLILISLALVAIHYRSKTKTLRQVNDMKTAFIHGITHEVNTPLNAVLGFSEVIADMANTNEQKDLAALVKVNSTKLVRVVDDTLYLSDYDAGTIIDINPVMVTLSDVLTKVKSRVELLCNDVCIDIVGNENLEVMAHESSLETLLFNLIHNAAVHGKAPVRVEYGVLDSGKTVIKVFDAGKKISKEVLDRMYERFYKGNQMADGLGVGLSIAMIAAERIGATIEYNDKYHIEGKEFIVTI